MSKEPKNAPIDLAARLEGSTSSVTLSTGLVLSFRHPTRDQIAAAMAEAGVDPSELQDAADDEQVGIAGLQAAARMARAYELVGAACIVDAQPRPELDGAPFRSRNVYGLRQLSEAAQEALEPYVARLGEHLFEQSNLAPAEGEA